MLAYSLMAFGSLFAIVDPFAAVPSFLALTARETPAQRRRMAKTACVTCAGVLGVFAVMGPAIFSLFGITVPAFQIAGGLVLLLAALDMLRAQRSPMRGTPEEIAEGMDKHDIAITPLAVPLLSGPGAITTSIVLAGRAENLLQRAAFLVVIILVASASYFTLILLSSGARKLSPTLLKIVTRLMGLLLAAIGVQFILSALKLG
ncbi:MAG: NAAT family transporter [Elusimicrobia bacterium]|nr:NAAT family transporter [Elusimicrobiota bacterium]